MSSGRHSLLGELEKMSGFYVNFYFKNIEYDDGFYGGEFSSPDSDVYCEFLPARGAFATDLDNRPTRTAIVPAHPHHHADPGQSGGLPGEKGSMMSFPVRTARSCTRKSTRESPSPSRRPRPGMRRTRSSLNLRARHLTREHVPLADVLAG